MVSIIGRIANVSIRMIMRQLISVVIAKIMPPFMMLNIYYIAIGIECFDYFIWLTFWAF